MSQMNRTVSPVIAAVWLVVLVCLTLTVVDNVRLRAKVSALSSTLDRINEVPVGPAPGSIAAVDPNGGSTLVHEGSRDETTIVLVASFSCPFSRQSMRVWRGLAAELPTARFVLLRVDGRTPDGITSNAGGKYGQPEFAFPGRPDLRWLIPSDSTVAAYRLGYVPQTMVVKKGRILFVRTGALTPADIARIRGAAI